MSVNVLSDGQNQLVNARVEPSRLHLSGRTGSASRVYSTDVFETVLCRAVGDPWAVHLLLGRRLRNRGLIRCSAEVFARARGRAERLARVNNGHCHSFEHIYQQLQFIMGLDDADRRALMSAELELEEDLIRPVPGAVAHLHRARGSGSRVVFLSNMYLDTAFIRRLLKVNGLLHEADGCYVSCDIGVGKGNGRAFREMAAREEVTPHQILHRGNDRRLDIEGGQAAGVRVEPFYEGNPNRYEKILESHAYETAGLSSVLAGASRLARLSIPTSSALETALRDVAAGVGAPMLVGYVLWVLREAERRGLRRLYFMARDGEVLFEIAERLAPRIGCTVELHYLYGSKRAWGVPSAASLPSDDFDWVPRASVQTLDALLGRLEISPDDAEAALASLGFPRDAWHRPIEQDSRALARTMLQHPGLQRAFVDGAESRRERALRFFEQEGLLLDDDWALVDTGWRGRLVSLLDKILQTRGQRVPLAFFFGRGNYDLAQDDLRIAAYFADASGGPTNGRGYLDRAPAWAVEMFCGAEHGVTLDYRTDGGRMVPVLQREDNQRLTEWGLPLVRKTILSFVDQLWLDEESIDVHANSRPAVADLLNAFVMHPTTAEASAVGSYPWEYERDVFAPLARPFSWRQVPQAIRYGQIRTRPAGAEWRAGCLQLSPAPLRLVLIATLAVQRRMARWLARLRKMT